MELLGALLATLPQSPDSVVVGPGLGRDAAVIETGAGMLVIKNDPITFVTREAGRYLVDVNANDLACLGAEPKWMLVTALLPEQSTTTALVSDLFGQVRESCERLGISLVGGHTEVTAGIDRPLLIGTLIGTVGPHGLVLPGSAQSGDRLLLAGPAGVEGTALLALERETELTEVFGAEFVARCQRFLQDPGLSIVRTTRSLIEADGVTALHDPTEGGVATGVREIALASGLGAVIDRDRIPLLPETRAIASHFSIDPLGMLSSGTVLAAVRPEAVDAIVSRLGDAGVVGAVIGKLTVPAAGFRIIEGGRVSELPHVQTDEVTRALARQ